MTKNPSDADEPQILSPKKVRSVIWKAWNTLAGAKGRTMLETKYINKMCYMLFFFSMVKCDKQLLDNWNMPDFNTLQERHRKEGFL